MSYYDEAPPPGEERCEICGSFMHSTDAHPRENAGDEPYAPPNPEDRCAICGSAFHSTAEHPG